MNILSKKRYIIKKDLKAIYNKKGLKGLILYIELQISLRMYK